MMRLVSEVRRQAEPGVRVAHSGVAALYCRESWSAPMSQSIKTTNALRLIRSGSGVRRQVSVQVRAVPSSLRPNLFSGD